MFAFTHLYRWLLLAQLLGLGGDSFADRHAAQGRLRSQGLLAHAALTAGKAHSGDPEVRRACDVLLVSLADGKDTLDDTLLWSWVLGCGVDPEPPPTVRAWYDAQPPAVVWRVREVSPRLGLAREDERDGWLRDDHGWCVTGTYDLIRLCRYRARWQAFYLDPPTAPPEEDLPLGP